LRKGWDYEPIPDNRASGNWHGVYGSREIREQAKGRTRLAVKGQAGQALG